MNGTILREGHIKRSRKVHLCCECDKWIPQGSSCFYQINDGGDDGDFGTAYWHERCDKYDAGKGEE